MNPNLRNTLTGNWGVIVQFASTNFLKFVVLCFMRTSTGPCYKQNMGDIKKIYTDNAGTFKYLD